MAWFSLLQKKTWRSNSPPALVQKDKSGGDGEGDEQEVIEVGFFRGVLGKLARVQRDSRLFQVLSLRLFSILHRNCFPFQVSVLLATVAMAAVAVGSATNLEVGLDFSLFLREDTYLVQVMAES